MATKTDTAETDSDIIGPDLKEEAMRGKTEKFSVKKRKVKTAGK